MPERETAGDHQANQKTDSKEYAVCGKRDQEGGDDRDGS